MFTWVVVVPVLLLVLAFFFGQRMSNTWFGLTLLIWWGALGSVVYMWNGDLIVSIVALILGILGITPAMLVGIGNGQKVSPSPAEQSCEAAKRAYQAYENLEPQQKETLHKGARTVLKLGLRYASDKLRGHGRTAEASLLRNGSKFL